MEVFVDACVRSKTLRDWLANVSLAGRSQVIKLRWSEAVLTEWLYHFRKDNPLLDEGQVEGYRTRLLCTFPDALVTGFAVQQPPWLRDEGDAHVHSAAAHVPCHYLVTNDKDFSAASDDEPYEVCTADEFLSGMYRSSPDLVCEAAARQFAYAWRRDGDRTDLLGPLRRAGAPRFAKNVQRLIPTRPFQEWFDGLTSWDQD